MRIISTVPSLTELLCDLGLEEELVGITKFCVHPEHISKSKTRIGGTKTLDLEKIRSLRPDLILANKEENVKEQIQALQEDHKVYVSDVKDLPSALEMIRHVSELTDTGETGEALIKEIEEAFDQLEPLPEALNTLYLIWKDPCMSIGQDTFIHDMLHRCGMRNVMKDHLRYPVVPLDALPPDLILLSSEPFPFNESHRGEWQKLFPDATVRIVDGTYFSWYGSRLKDAPAYFQSIIGAIRP